MLSFNAIALLYLLGQVDLGIALAMQGRLDEAYGAGIVALDSPRQADSLRSRMDTLDRLLTARYPDATETREFHERYLVAVNSAA
ncbi:MAG TPA: hypothetical protein VF995_02285 [Actinomycetota bacterium]